jgi:hypothetical protein
LTPSSIGFNVSPPTSLTAFSGLIRRIGPADLRAISRCAIEPLQVWIAALLLWIIAMGAFDGRDALAVELEVGKTDIV